MNSNRKEEVYQSVCRGCHGGCSVWLHVRDGQLVKVMPDKASPFNRGQMCIKGLSVAEMMYHPDRILSPLKQTGARGSEKWVEVDWDTALGEISWKLNQLRTQNGPETIAIGQGTGRHHFMHVIRFANALRTPNWYEPGLANCFIPRITVSQLTYGGFVVADYYGKVLPKTILFWGHNPVVSGPDGELSFPVKRALKARSYGIAIDPRRSETAKKCKMWLPIRPGTDAALALAMVHVIISEDLYDRQFVEKWTVGFNRLKAHVSNYTPQWAEEVTWIPAEKIVRAARRYATEKPSVIEWGVSIEHTPNSLQTVRAVALLRGLTGNLDVPGADILGMNIVKPYPTLKDKLPKDQRRKRIGAEQFKLLGGFRAILPSAHIPGVLKAMRTGDPYPIKALLNFGSNPLVTIAESKQVYESLLNLDLIVVADMFMTPTAAIADYVLPAAFWPEVNQLVELPYVAENAVFAQQKVVHVGDCRQDEEILIDLARRLDLPGAEQSLEDIFNDRLEPLELNFNSLKKKGMVYPDHEYRKYEKSGFRTPSKKVELYSKSLERMGYDPLPVYREPPESHIETLGLAQDYPYVLTTGSRRIEFFHSDNRQIQSLRRRRPDPVAEIHPRTAAAHGISTGEWIFVASPRGRIRMKASVTEDIAEGVVNIDHGWWFPEKGGPDFGVWESNANMLTSGGPPYDPAFGSYSLRALLCRIGKTDGHLD